MTLENRMKSLLTVLIIGCLVTFLISGCELYTPPNSGPGTAVGNDLLITEVFPLNPSTYYSFSWIELFNPTNRYISTVDITRPASGYIIGYNGSLLKTTDDGDSWVNVGGGAVNANFHAITFPWPDTGFAVGEGGAFYRINHSETDSVPYRFIDIHANLPASVQGRTLNGIDSRLQVPVLFVCGDSGTVLRSANMGNTGTWISYVTGVRQNLNALQYVKSTAVYVVGDSITILKGTLGGNYQAQIPPFSHTLAGTNYKSVSFISDTGWIVGTGGRIAFTANGGRVWTDQPTGVTATLRHVYVGDSSRYVWACGDNGTVLKSLDQGTSWEKEPTGTTSSLYDIRFTDIYNGWAAGDNGTIIRTTDGGFTWNRENSGTTEHLSNAYFLQRTRYVFHFYQLSMWAQKHHYFVDPVTKIVNRDVLLDTLVGRTLLVPGPATATFLPPQSYLVINNDQRKYDNHYQNTYGDPRIISLPTLVDSEIIGADKDKFIDTLILGLDSVVWRLKQSGEVRLEKFDLNMTVDPFTNLLVFDTTYPNTVRVIDLCRWGGFKPNAGDFGDEPTYELNQPVGTVPDWYSIARFNGDVGGDINQSNTARSFYICNTPIPGQGSQRRK
jgi:photosystem II stability/assembly factor-like uncharacterized protein